MTPTETDIPVGDHSPKVPVWVSEATQHPRRLCVVPVLFGSGKRFFGSFTGAPQMLDNPQIIEGDRVLHLVYAIRRP
ncbi:MAG: hypothetical protein ACRDTJ_19720 [Pseudonocardiaceae bacterium]